MIMNTINFELNVILIHCNPKYFFFKEFRGDRVDNFEAEVTVELLKFTLFKSYIITKGTIKT